MSADDPTDDELERDLNRDLPLRARQHGPKLGTESRAINPRELLAAEAAGQGGELEDYRQSAPEPPRAPRRPPPRQDEPALRGNVRPLRRPPTLSAGAEAAPSYDALVWERFVIAALPLADSVAAAAELADILLEERRRRFG